MTDLNLFQTILDDLSVAVAIVNRQHRILYHNKRFADLFEFTGGSKESFVDHDFYQALAYPLFIDGCFAPFLFALKHGEVKRTILSYPSSNGDQRHEKRFEMLVSRTDVSIGQSHTPLLRVEIKDISEMNQYERRLQTLRKAGNDLAFFTNKKLLISEERIKERFTSKIESQMHSVLNYNVCEIRLLDKKTNELLPFLNFGMDIAAIQRPLCASSNGNGITGFVASSGEPYICNDTKNDALYIQGAVGVKSSITVPLIFNNEIIGVCNVESRDANAFSQRDLIFLELYAKDLASAIHLLEYMHDNDRFLRKQCGRALRNDLDAKLLNLQTLAAKVGEQSQKLDSNSQIPELDSLLTECFEFRAKVERCTKNLLDYEFNVQDDIQDYLEEDASSPHVVDQKDERLTQTIDQLRPVLKDKCFLFVSNDPSRFLRQQLWLNAFGCRMETVTSSLTALHYLQRKHFDFVISDLNPDGPYFEETTKEEAYSLQRNEFQFSYYDIHEGPNYFVPAKDNPVDVKIRERIYHEIYTERKLDAFFLLQEIYNHGLSPVFILTFDALKYDSTHVRKHVNALRKTHCGHIKLVEPSIPYPYSTQSSYNAQKVFFMKLGQIIL